MPAYSLLDSPVVLSRLLAPAIEAHEVSHRRYRCTEFTDLEFIEMGVARVVSESMTGRDFLQRHADNGRKEVELTLFFKALQSQRRLANLASVNLALAPVMKASCLDPFAAVPELKKFAIYSGDGHYHGAACHDVKLVGSSGEPKKYPTGHFFMLDLRTHHARHMATAEQGGARKGEHDMRAIKRTDIDVLRCGEPKGRKVIVAWDPAGIDLAFWQRSKRRSGLYFLSREKENMNLTVVRRQPVDRTVAENTGVVSDEIVVPASDSGELRRVVYTDTSTGRTYTYITTEMTLPPWVIALIYKHRWDIEKVFDEFKNKLYERKSWASGETAKTIHAQFLCLSHNLMLLLSEDISQVAGITDEKEKKRRAGRMEDAMENGASFVATLIQRFTVRSLKFIRWLRNHIYRNTSWEHALERLRHTYATY